MENIKMTYIHYFVRTKGGLNWGIEANDNPNRNTTCFYIVYTYLHWSICQWNRYCSVATGNPPNFPLLLLPYHSCIVMISCASLAGLTLLFISCGNRREVLMNLYVWYSRMLCRRFRVANETEIVVPNSLARTTPTVSWWLWRNSYWQKRASNPNEVYSSKEQS